ncbi:hypothetical protein HMSSN139_50540 [Paenibacillus sp. HMSSN-139]|nr:hypothetical protein HMSSN139_50540 [Paenibacillus sp. HMSSN-139]
MSYKFTKWLILIVPTLVVGVWEVVRHQFLMPYVSMELGNVLTPILLFAVSITLLYRWFAYLERMQEELAAGTGAESPSGTAGAVGPRTA